MMGCTPRRGLETPPQIFHRVLQGFEPVHALHTVEVLGFLMMQHQLYLHWGYLTSVIAPKWPYYPDFAPITPSPAQRGTPSPIPLPPALAGGPLLRQMNNLVTPLPPFCGGTPSSHECKLLHPSRSTFKEGRAPRRLP
jgi:hypothetical protein